MSTLNELIQKVAFRAGDALFSGGAPQYAICSKSKMVDFFNEAQNDFVIRTECLTEEYSFPLVQYEFEYNLPSNNLKVIEIFYKGRKVWSCTDREIKETQYRGQINTINNYEFDILQGKGNNGVLRINPSPSSSSASTTLTTAIDTDDTSVVLASISGLDHKGVISIGSERIAHVYMNSSTKTLTVPTNGRGYQGTTAASHAESAVVTNCDMMIHYVKTPLELALDSLSVTPEIPETYHHALEERVLWQILHAIDRSRANDHLQVYYDLVDKCKKNYFPDKDIHSKAQENLVRAAGGTSFLEYNPEH